MNSTNITTDIPENQLVGLSAVVPTPPYAGINPIRAQAYEIESRIGNIAILIEAIFDKLDQLNCDTPDQHKVHNAVSCFANSAMESAQFIRAANESILKLTCGGAK